MANVLGNLVQRTISMAKKYFEGEISNPAIHDDLDDSFLDSINHLKDAVIFKMDQLQVSDAITEIFNVLRNSNKYIDETTPWILAKTDDCKDRLETVLYHLLESIRVCAILLESFMPDTSKEILRQLNQENLTPAFVADNSYSLNDPAPLFQRIDREKFMAELDNVK